MTEQRNTFLMRAQLVGKKIPSIQMPCANEQQAREHAQDFASEYGETAQLFFGPLSAEGENPYGVAQRRTTLGDPAPEPEMKFVCNVEPAKPAVDGKRGIFASNPITFEPTIVHSPELDPQELRFWLLFWDEIGIATNNVEPREFSATERFLHEEKLLNRWATNWACEVDGHELYAHSFWLAFSRVNKIQPGKWTAALGGRSISFGLDDNRSGCGAKIQLHQVIPVPAAETPLEDVLEFSRRRREELICVRNRLEALYDRIMNSDEGGPRKEVAALQNALIGLVKVARDNSFPFLKASFEAKMKLPSSPNFASQNYSLAEVGGLLSAANAGVEIQIGGSLEHIAISRVPYRCRAKYHTELDCV